ncbi:MAG: choice-of-anchor D domain-containing protein [Bradymonadaceae bacterium]
MKSPVAFNKALYLCAAILLALTGVVACGDDSEKGSGGIDDQAAGRILVTPTPVQFAEIAVGQEDRFAVTVTNTGEGPLRINTISLVEDGADDLVEFHRGQDWANSLTLGVGERRDLTVIYRPLNQIPDSGYIEFLSNDPESSTLRVPLSSANLQAQLFSPRTVSFDRLPAGETAWQVTPVRNIGTIPLRIDDLVLTGSSDFALSFLDPSEENEANQESDRDAWPTVVQPGEQFFIRVHFSPTTNDPASAEVIFFSNDAAEPEYRVTLLGNSGAPCILLNYEQEISFGQSSVGQTANRTVIIENCSLTAPLRIDEINITDDASGAFGIRPDSFPGNLPAEPTTIEARRTASFVVTYFPVLEEESTGTLLVRSNDPARSAIEVPLTGTGTDNECPVAVGEVSLPDSTRLETEINTLPLTTVELTAVNSYDPDGQVASYEWTIISQPENSNARLNPQPDVMEPLLYLDLAGTYEIELVVYDNQSQASCEPAIVTVRAIPQDDIHIQLVWDAPSVVDPREGHGVDLDLHYLHPLGRWNQAPHDIFWDNRTADWGVLGDETDDPRLDIDDTYKGGPENVNHSNPESGIDYGVGVYYFADRGFGAAYATVRIYIRGELRFEVKNTYMPHQGYFWHAAMVRWPSTDIIRRDRVEFGFPVR